MTKKNNNVNLIIPSYRDTIISHIRNKTNLPVNVAEDPLLSVVKGTGIVLENLKKFQDVLIQP